MAVAARSGSAEQRNATTLRVAGEGIASANQVVESEARDVPVVKDLPVVKVDALLEYQAPPRGSTPAKPPPGGRASP